MARKTIDVATLRVRVNKMLAAEGSSREGRVALAVLIECVLMDTGNYHGFNYQRSEFLPAEDQRNGHALKENHDDTRRVYF